MNDQTLMNNYLLLLKSTVEVYVHGTLESSNEKIRELLRRGLDDTISSQGATYDEMVDYGWYKVTNVDDKKISQALSKIKECK